MKMDEISFHKSADQCLHQIQDALDYLEDYDTIGPVDIYLSQGVLNATIGSYGTWVINKQTPNRQIWWSSPISGPKRYEYKEDGWYNTRDGTSLKDILRDEIYQVTKVDLKHIF